MSSILPRLPIEIQQSIVYMLCDQADLVSLSLVSKLYYSLATKSLYSKLYLNDSHIEKSNVWPLAPTWSFLALSEKLHNDEENEEEANAKFELLVRSLEENSQLCSNVIQVRLNWDLDIDLQVKFVELLTNNSKSLKILENITDPVLSDSVAGKKYTDNLTSLDLPPPNPLPSPDIDPDYLFWLKKTVTERLESQDVGTLKYLTVFMDPVLLFNNVYKLEKKLEIENFKVHCRADAYATSLYSPHTINLKELKDIFDVKYLKELTIISWFDNYFSSTRVFKFDQWKEFRNLQDITMIAVTFEDKAISEIINNCYSIKRLKLDFSQPQREIGTDTLVYRSISNHSKSLEFLDIKLNLKNKIVNLDLRTLKIILKVICPCDNCQLYVLKEILHQKILPLESDFIITGNNFQHFARVDFFGMFFTSALSPYSKAVDKYPSVKTESDDIEIFLDRFNEENAAREHFVPLVSQDFFPLYHCLVHNMKPDLSPFVANFPKLKFMVLNDIAFIFETDNDLKLRYPKPLFYNEGFKTNFGDSFKLDKSFNNVTSANSLFFLN